MEIKETGKYVLTEDFIMRGRISIATIEKGTEMEVTQVDSRSKRVIGPNFSDWTPWNMPVEKLPENDDGS